MKDLIIKEYREGKSREKLAEKYNSSSYLIKKMLNEEGIKVRGLKQREYNEKVFDAIDTEEKAYWLGFIYADGYNGDTFEIALQEQDKGHLEKFTCFLNTDIQLKYREKTRAYRFSMKSKYMQGKLRELGVVPGKSSVLDYPTFINADLEKHFIRGYFDGDGCINIRSCGKQKGQIRTSLLGTKELLEGVLTTVGLNANLHRKSNNKAYHFEFSGEKAIKFIQYMYEGNTICLDRKGLLANAVLNRNI